MFEVSVYSFCSEALFQITDNTGDISENCIYQIPAEVDVDDFL